MGDSFSAMFNKLDSEMGLKLTDFGEAMGADSLSDSDSGLEAKCEWWDEKSGGKLTGVTKAQVVKSDGSQFYQLDVWVGPSSFVPHMLLKVLKSADGSFGIEADFVPRGQFAMGSDSTYVEDYYENEASLAWYADAVTKAKGTHLSPSPSLYGRILRSPMHLAVGGMSENDACACAEAHLDRWMGHMAEAKPSEARQRGGLNVRDDKLRQFAFRAALTDAKTICGSADSARALAAGLTGPQAEAYVGGGS